MRKNIFNFLIILLLLKYPFVAFSSSCSVNYYACSNEELCKYATYVENGIVLWTSADDRKNYVEHAQGKGLVCEVGNPIKISEETLLTTDFLSTLKTAKN